MSEVSVSIDSSGPQKRLREILDRLRSDELEGVLEDAAQYMVRATVNRLLRSKTAPNGERWPGLAELTIDLKGHDRPLFETGELARSVQVEDVSGEGFTIGAEADHAGFMQYGVERLGGSVYNPVRGWRARPKGPIPARPFMGFSETNVRRISRMIRNHIDEQARSFE